LAVKKSLLYYIAGRDFFLAGFLLLKNRINILDDYLKATLRQLMSISFVVRTK